MLKLVSNSDLYNILIHWTLTQHTILLNTKYLNVYSTQNSWMCIEHKVLECVFIAIDIDKIHQRNVKIS